MSVQFGRWNFDGPAPPPEYLEEVSATLAPYGHDCNKSYSKGGIGIVYRAFQTTQESHSEKQPYVSAAGAVVTWDGRLDNRSELVDELQDSLSANSTDVAITARAYDEWGTSCFAKLIGDWAVSIWEPLNRSLTLAKDPIGSRHLFYSIDANQITWSTILDPLVMFAERSFILCEEYIAGWFTPKCAPAHLTPYVGILSVPPSSCLIVRPGRQIIRRYWNFDGSKMIRYRRDAEYEEHFRAVFTKAVERRLRSDQPILAELSGGMDSSSIVCVADTLVARGESETPRIDTISWYDQSDEALNELPYVLKIEQKRGRTGYHIDTALLTNLGPSFTSECCEGFAATPAVCGCHSEFARQYAACMTSGGYRVTLSGIGGNEVTGGCVPSPQLEIQNLLARAQFVALAHRLRAWALKMKRPRLRLLWEATRGFLPRAIAGSRNHTAWAGCFHSGFNRRNEAALFDHPFRVKVFGPLPSFQDNLDALDALRRLLASVAPQPDLVREVRYPYLDRTLLEFLYSIPREQIVGVGQRRSLMRRALSGIVPVEIMNRRQRAPSRELPKKQAYIELASLMAAGHNIVSSSMGILDRDRLLESLLRSRGDEFSEFFLRRALTLESWLLHVTSHGVLTNSASTGQQGKRRSQDIFGPLVH